MVYLKQYHAQQLFKKIIISDAANRNFIIEKATYDTILKPEM